MQTLISIIFLVLSTAFIATLFMGLFKMLSQQWSDTENMGKQLLHLFKWPLIIFVMFVIFVMVILPRMNQ